MAPRQGNNGHEQGNEQRVAGDDAELDLEQDPQDDEDAPEDEDGEGEDDAELEAGGEDPEVDSRPPSRGERRFQELTRRVREQEAEIERMRRQPAAPQPQASGPREETDQEFETRVALLPPDERVDERFKRSERLNGMRMAHLQLQSTNATDKASFDAKAAYDRRYDRYAQEVETRHAELLAGNPAKGLPPQFVSREILLKLVIGEKVLAAQKDGKGRGARRNERSREERRAPRAPSTRGDAGGGSQQRRGSGGSEQEQRKRRLENMEL